MLEGENTTVFQFSRPTAETRQRQTTARRCRCAPDRARRHRRPEFPLGNQTQRRRGLSFFDATRTRWPRPRTPKSKPRSALPSRPRPTANCACLPTPANIIRSRNGVKTFRIRSSKAAARPAAATPTARAGLKFRCRKARGVTLVATAEEDAGRSSSAGNASRLDHEPREAEPARIGPLNSNFSAPRGNSSSAATKAKPSSPAIPGFWTGARDSLICARGLLAAGMAEDVRQILLTFAKFEKDGTLPNTHLRRRRFEPRHLRCAAVVCRGVRRFFTGEQPQRFLCYAG